MTTRRQILTFGVISEAGLALCFFVWVYWSGAGQPLFPSLREVLWGAAAGALLLAANIGFFELVVPLSPKFAVYSRFVREVVKPLIDLLDWKAAAVISISAGLGEELFFRGFVQSALGIVPASMLFAVLHFGTALKQYLAVAVLYFFVGLYLGLLFQLSGSVWAPVVAHLAYDFGAILYLKRFGPKSPPARY